MKRYFYTALAIILILSVAGVAYGIYLNHTGEKNIASRLEKRTLMLSGERAQRRVIVPLLKFDVISLYTPNKTDVVSRVDGVVESSFITQGQMVGVGTPLMYIANEDIPIAIMKTEGSIAKAEAELNRTRVTYERYQSLVAENAASQQQLDETRAYYLTAKATIAELAAQQKANYIMKERQTITSPIAGQVLMIYKNSGTFVSAGTPVCLVGDFTKLYFKISLNDRKIKYLLPFDMPKEMVFNRADFTKVYGTAYGAGNIGDHQSFTATIEEVYPPIEVPAEMRSVVFSVDNISGMLEPQSYRNVEVISNASSESLSIPLAALTDQMRDKVFVWNSDGILSLRDVVTGEDDGKYIEILSGLYEGEVVIISDSDGLKDGLMADVDVKGN